MQKSIISFLLHFFSSSPPPDFTKSHLFDMLEHIVPRFRYIARPDLIDLNLHPYSNAVPSSRSKRSTTLFHLYDPIRKLNRRWWGWISSDTRRELGRVSSTFPLKRISCARCVHPKDYNGVAINTKVIFFIDGSEIKPRRSIFYDFVHSLAKVFQSNSSNFPRAVRAAKDCQMKRKLEDKRHDRFMRKMCYVF